MRHLKLKPLLLLTAFLLTFSGCNPNGIFYDFWSFKSHHSGSVHGAPVLETPDSEVEKTEGPFLQFYALGCAGAGNAGQAMTAKSMAKTAVAHRPEFILYLGDNFYGRGVSSVEDSQWQSKFEQVYDPAALSMPFYAVLGNHDYHKNPQAQVEYSARSARWKMPARYYSFEQKLEDGTTVEFFGLDSIAIEKGKAAEQLQWLEEKLGKSKADWKIVYGHHPMYSGAKRFFHQSRKMRDSLEEIFVRHNVDVYLSAHNHSIEILKDVSGVHYIVSGGGARPRDVHWTEQTKFAHADLGFVWLRIFKSHLEIFVVDGREGKLLFRDQVQKALV